MKQKFYVTGFIFAICIAVFFVVSGQPVSVNSRFNGVLFSEETELENDTKISFEGKLHDTLFTKEKFTGYVTIQSKTLPEEYEAVSLQFGKGGTATCKLISDGKETGVLTVYKDFKKASLEVTDETYSKGSSTYLAAPATSIEQAKDLLK